MFARIQIVGFQVCVAILLACVSCQAQVSFDGIVAETDSVDAENKISVVYHRPYEGTPERVVATGVRPSTRIPLYTQSPDKADIPPIFGRAERTESGTEFYPRFPLQAGISYYLEIRERDAEPTVFTFSIPKPPVKPVATVTQIFPSASKLPENLLKFYIHFSHPMSSGDVYRHVQLLDANDLPIELPFLELGEELWDSEQRRLTLLFDPGRIKSGLMPRRESGAVLEEGKRYTLEIRDTWKDADSRPLKKSYRKSFTAIAGDGKSPVVENWGIKTPDAETLAPLEIHFEESLDEALVQRVIHILDPEGKRVDGDRVVDQSETRLRISPTHLWKVGRYQLRVESVLEDLAGNSVGRPFEVDLEASEHERPERYVYRSFQIR